MGIIPAVAIVEEAGGGVGGFGAEAVREVGGFGAGGEGGSSEGVVLVVGGDGSGVIEVFRNVAVAVV